MSADHRHEEAYVWMSLIFPRTTHCRAVFLPTTSAKGLDVLDLGKLSSRFVSVSCTNSKAGFEVGLKGVGWLKTVVRLQDIAVN